MCTSRWRPSRLSRVAASFSGRRWRWSSACRSSPCGRRANCPANVFQSATSSNTARHVHVHVHTTSTVTTVLYVYTIHCIVHYVQYTEIIVVSSSAFLSHSLLVSSRLVYRAQYNVKRVRSRLRTACSSSTTCSPLEVSLLLSARVTYLK